MMDRSLVRTSLFGVRFWGLSALYTVGTALLIGVPTVLIPTPFFSRVIPTRPLDYLIWVLSAVLLGPVLALATLYPSPREARTANRSGGGRALLGVILSFLSVGCPVCNQLVVLLLGIGGAITFFDPLRPFLGVVSIMILAVTLFLRVRVLRYGCPVPRARLRLATKEREQGAINSSQKCVQIGTFRPRKSS